MQATRILLFLEATGCLAAREAPKARTVVKIHERDLFARCCGADVDAHWKEFADSPGSAPRR